MKVLLIILLVLIYLIPKSLITFKVYLLSGVLGLWVLSVFYFICRSQVDNEELKEGQKILPLDKIIDEHNLFEVEYLLKGKITFKMLSLSILELLRKKILLLKYNPQIDDLALVKSYNYSEKPTSSEKYLINWFINNIGNGEKVLLSSIKKDAFSNSAYFLSCYDDWHTLASFEGAKSNFIESKRKILDETFAYAMISLLMALYGLYIQASPFLTVASLVATLALIIYVNSFYYVRTNDGNEAYSSWTSLVKSIETSDDTKNINSLSKLQKIIIYSYMIKQQENKPINIVVDDSVVGNNEFIKYNKEGIFDELCQKINTLVPLARSSNFVYSKNMGSKAILKPKNNKEE